jgi:hypothetical protein
MYASHWHQTLKSPAAGDHIAQAYQDEAFLCETVAQYIGAGLEAGEAGIIIARPGHCDQFERALRDAGADPQAAREQGRLLLIDADEALGKFMRDGTPQWEAFDVSVGALVAAVGAKYPMVRAYGEMVDVLWQKGERDAALKLEDFWNQLGRRERFSLLCGYRMDPLDSRVYGGALECVCRAHTHLIPARDYDSFDEAVAKASETVLDRAMSQMVLSLTAARRPTTQMPIGQATLLWLQKHMPLTAEKVLAEARTQL